MVKQTAKPASNPTPVMQEEAATGTSEATVDSVLATAPASTVVNIDDIKGQGTRRNIFTESAKAVTANAVAKMQTMQDVRQKLAEASDMFKEGDEKAKEANAIAATAGLKLYQARVDGLASQEEVSGVLGDIFGYKSKKDGTASKTPDGQGEAIRKRVVRAVQAREFATGEGEAGRFFEGIDPNEMVTIGEGDNAPSYSINSILDGMETGDIGFWAAYELFAKVKAAAKTTVNKAFDPKHIASLVAALAEDDAAEALAGNADLVAAYGALIDILAVQGEVAAAFNEAEAAAA